MRRATLGSGWIVLTLAATVGCSSSGEPEADTGDAATTSTSASSGAGGVSATAGSTGGSGGTSGATTGEAGAANPATSGSGGSAGEGGQDEECGGIAIPMGDDGPSGGAVDEWTDVTPAGISLNPSDFSNDNYGAQDVLVDPVRPSDLYAFFCHQGVYKSTDYGQSWTKVNTGENGDVIDSGKPWGEAIETNRCRDPNTPPTLYSTGSQGRFWRSLDGGVNWQGFDLPDDGKPRPQDAYNVDVDPYDSQHLILGYHEQPGVSESLDGGETWRAIELPSGMNSGGSWYLFFIDTGEASTTHDTWLAIAQATGGIDGTWRTTDGGESFERVDSNEHGHGQAQIFQSDGIVYMGGAYGDQGWGVSRSSDFGATWTHVGSTSSQNGVYGTGKFVYAQSGGANAGGQDQSQSERAPLPDGSDWSTWPVPVTNGPKRAAVTYDGANYIVVGGNWLAGLARYVEP